MKRLWPLLLASTLGFAVLCSLGTWQVVRLAEKTKLIATLEARMSADPISLATALDRQIKGEDLEYVRVTARGQLDTSHALAKVSSFDGKPGWQIIAPFTSEDGISVLVDVGTAPEKQLPDFTIATLTGVIRLHHKGRGLFDNDNNPEQNEWYWWDLPEMKAAARTPDAAKTAPFVVQRLPEGKNQSAPYAELPKVELSNNHLGYAVTWFGLAAALLVVTGFFARSLVLDRQGEES